MGTGDHLCASGGCSPTSRSLHLAEHRPLEVFLQLQAALRATVQELLSISSTPAAISAAGLPGAFGNGGRGAWQMPGTATPPPAVLLAAPKPHPSGISLRCKNSLQSSWRPPFPAFFKQTAPSTSRPRAGTTSLAAAVTAATPRPECVCRHRPSSACRAPGHVDPRMLRLLLSSCKKFTGSSQMPFPEF